MVSNALVNSKAAPRQRHTHWATYVKNTPDKARGVIAENIYYKFDDEMTYVRVYRPYEGHVMPPDCERVTPHDDYIEVEYTDGCICYCYKVDDPIPAHARLPRYSTDDEFELDQGAVDCIADNGSKWLRENRNLKRA